MKKTTPINLLVHSETKRKLQEKARALNLTLTGYLEKIANEPVCFIDANVRVILESLNLQPKEDL